jgi:RNA polymerase sigma-70 factor (ECF subfamily)
MLERPVDDASNFPELGHAATGAPPRETRAAAAYETLIGAARSGCSRSLGELVARYRKYLLHVANLSLSPAIRAKVAPSDLVQETLLHVHRSFGTFRGESEEELLNWLRRLLYFRALHAARRFGGTASRDVRRELSLADGEFPSSGLVDPAPTPCAGSMAREAIEELQAALAALPADARRIVLLRSVERQPFAEIGSELGCSADAARARWVRAIGQMRMRNGEHG